LWHTSYLSQNTYCPEKLASLVLNFNYAFSPLGNGLFRRELLQGKRNVDNKIWCIDPSVCLSGYATCSLQK
jgi:hypothetical protein